MYLLAMNLGLQLEKQVRKDGNVELIGEYLRFQKIYHCKISNGENHDAIEEYIPGQFVKHLNNNGMICGPSTNSALLQEKVFEQKVECPTHYSYENSNTKIMFEDLKGSYYTLFNPKIASMHQWDEDNQFLYCTGSLSELAINKFISVHTCNFRCQFLGLKPQV